MENTVTYNVKKLLNGRGMYGSITITVAIDNAMRDSEIVLRAENCKRWEAALNFGFTYFNEYYSKGRENKPIRVEVLDIHDHSIDSSSILMTYLIISGLCQFLKIPPFVFINEDSSKLEFVH